MVKLAPEVHYRPWYDHVKVGWYYLVPTNNKTVEVGPFMSKEDAQASADRMQSGASHAANNPTGRHRN